VVSNSGETLKKMKSRKLADIYQKSSQSKKRTYKSPPRAPKAQNSTKRS
jgi:hypothetical protein